MTETNTSAQKEFPGREAAYADITEKDQKKITELEKKLQKETGENVALVAYKL